jgi:hypothetical protein
MVNFRRPYASADIREFWRRWHISLSSWFRDYVYMPLGGNRATPVQWLRNICIVFILSGIWHGANWTFVAWGGLHALYYVVGRLAEPFRRRATASSGRAPRLLGAWRVFVTFHLVVFAWIFFRADSVTSALVIAIKVVTAWPDVVVRLAHRLVLLPFDGAAGSAIVSDVLKLDQTWTATLWNPMTQALLVAILLVELTDWLGERTAAAQWFARSPLPIRWSGYAVLVAAVAILAPFGSNQFIYFQF